MLTPISDICKHCALFFDSTGYPVGKKKLKYKERVFVFENGLYNFKPQDSSFFKIHRIWNSTKYYFYTVGNPEPISLKLVPHYILRSEDYKEIYESKVLRDLNLVGQKGFIDWLFNPRVLVPLLIVIAVIWYFASGGKVT